jgi:hypothetical protein
MWLLTGMHDISPHHMDKHQIAALKKALLSEVGVLRNVQRDQRKYAKDEGHPLVKNGLYNI